MLYRLWFSDGVGHPLTMTGFKLVKNDAGFDIWKDTTTLFTRVLRGHVPEGGDEPPRVVASGIIIIRARDFAKQLTTFRSTSPSIGARDRRDAEVRRHLRPATRRVLPAQGGQSRVAA